MRQGGVKYPISHLRPCRRYQSPTLTHLCYEDDKDSSFSIYEKKFLPYPCTHEKKSLLYTC